ncbi:MAG: site-specific DNA-methyltransferase [Acidobacteriota bacterium]|nr:site-specific DNA-methyltransferase [Acidobacteriota bacterium]
MTPFYQDETTALYCADNREVLSALEDKSVDHVITDPPYSEHTHAKQWIGHALTSEGAPRCSTNFKELSFAAITNEQIARFTSECARLSRRWSLIFCDLESIVDWREAVQRVGLDYVRACVWDKVDSAPQFTGDRPASSAEAFICAHPKGRKAWNGGGRRNVFRHAVNGSESGPKQHPTQKPIALMREMIALFTDAGDLVLDPFMGSGSTGVACAIECRRFMGIELSEEYCEVAKARILRAKGVPHDPPKSIRRQIETPLFAEPISSCG